jgi:hypothetical protein
MNSVADQLPRHNEILCYSLRDVRHF